ncbi:MAG: enhanced serine sensitivity protein SseB C-terminal domain-containing protein [Thermoanaerobaculia bacterium]
MGPSGSAKPNERDTSISLVVAEIDIRQPRQAFSSRSRVQEAAGDRQLTWAAMAATDLLPILAGSGLLLNSASDYGKVFSPDEVADLANGRPPAFGQRWVAQKQTEVMVGIPADIPSELVDSLASFFRTRPAVRAAYLGMIHVPERDEYPVLLVGIDILGDPGSILEETGAVLNGAANDLGMIDLTTVDGSGLEGFFREEALTIYERQTEVS